MIKLKMPANPLNRYGKYNFVIMLCAVIAVALLLVGVAMEMYNSSGAAQVDLSRPGFKSVQKQAGVEGESEKTFAASGEITKETLDEFNKIYDKHATRAAAATNFSESAVTDESLQVFAENANSNLETQHVSE